MEYTLTNSFMEPDRTSFPLKPVDAQGQAIAPNMAVEILSIPTWLTHDLPAEDVDRLRQYAGQILRVQEIDSSGYVWFALDDLPQPCSFCLRPEEVRVVQP